MTRHTTDSSMSSFTEGFRLGLFVGCVIAGFGGLILSVLF